ncbi:MAG: hypothetical protein AAF671_12085, partial [Pseudomonadota bacterium]
QLYFYGQETAAITYAQCSRMNDHKCGLISNNYRQVGSNSQPGLPIGPLQTESIHGPGVLRAFM